MRTLDVDIAIVGSGAAGATLAATLAEHMPSHRPWRIVLLEKGGHFGREFFNQREWEMTRALYAGRGTRFTDDGAIPVRGGECVGGGTTINVALSFDPVARVWDAWRAQHGLEGFSLHDASDYGIPGLSLKSALAEVRARMNVHAPEDREVNRNNALFAQGCRALGIGTRKFELNMQGCIGCGFCTSGCAYDAKRGALVTFIPDALARGVQLVHQAEVERIERVGTRVSGLQVSVSPTRPGSRANSVGEGPLRIRSKLVICCAGAIETPALLQRSGHPDPHDRVGRGLVLHPSLPFIGRVQATSPEVAGHRGVEGSMYSDHFAASDGFYFECLFGHPLYGAAVLPGFGTEHFELMRSYRRLFGFGAMLIDVSHTENRVRWDGARGSTRIQYCLTELDAARLRKAARLGIEIAFAAGAEEAWLASDERLGELGSAHFRSASDARFIDALRFTPVRTTLTSAHAQATMRMGSDPRVCSLDSRGEAFGVQNLIVCDASAFPSSCGANPMLSIMSMARYQGRRIAHEAARHGL